MRVILGREMYVQHSEIFVWCREMFPEEKYEGRIDFGYQTYTFQSKEDALVFILKWGGEIR